MAGTNGSDADASRGATKEKRSGSVSEIKPGNPKTGKNPSTASNASKVSAQMQKMKDANAKYKNLLKMAKERIEQQEIELKEMRGEPVESDILGRLIYEPAVIFLETSNSHFSWYCDDLLFPMIVRRKRTEKSRGGNCFER